MNKEAQQLTFNLVTGIVYQAVLVCANFFTKQAIRYQLGTDYLGLQTVLSNVSDVLIFAFGGLGLALLYQLYKPFADNDQPTQASILAYFDRVYRKMALGSAGVGVIASIVVLWSVNANISVAEILLCYALLLAGVIINARYSMYYYFFMADQRRYVACITCSVVEIVGTAVGCLLLYSGFPYAVFLVCLLAKSCIPSFVYKRYVGKRYRYLKEKPDELSREEKDAAKSDIRDLIIARVGMTLVNSTDSVIISGVVGTAIAGCYSGYYFVLAGILAIVSNVYEPLMSKVGNLQASAGKEEVFKAFVKMYVVCLGIAAICTASFYWLCEDFLTLWMGSEVLLPQAVLAVCAINLYMGIFRQNVGAFRLSAGLFSRIGWVTVVRGVLNVVVSLVLGWFFGVVGVVVATTICDLATVYWFEPYLLYKHFGKPLAIELGFQLGGILLTFCSLAVAGFVAMHLGACSSWFGFIGKTCVVGLSSCIVPAILCLAVHCADKRRSNG